MFQVELSDPPEAEAIISSNITCPQTGIIFKVEEFRAVQQCNKQPKKLRIHFETKLGSDSTTPG